MTIQRASQIEDILRAWEKHFSGPYPPNTFINNWSKKYTLPELQEALDITVKQWDRLSSTKTVAIACYISGILRNKHEQAAGLDEVAAAIKNRQAVTAEEGVTI